MRPRHGTPYRFERCWRRRQALSTPSIPKGDQLCIGPAQSGRPHRVSSEPSGIETVTVLLNAGADLELAAPIDEDEGDFRATPLWYAVARGENLPLARFLLAKGADASTSLWAVVWRDDDETCRELLQTRPKLNLRAHGETPIFYAARLKRLKTLDVLIEAGVDPTIADERGRDAVDIARARRLPRSVIERARELGAAD